MRKSDKELFRLFRENGLADAYYDLCGCSVEKLSMMLYSLNQEKLSTRVDVMCRSVILKALDSAKGREKALK